MHNSPEKSRLEFAGKIRILCAGVIEMENDFSLVLRNMSAPALTTELEALNARTEAFGLRLSQDDIASVVQATVQALTDSGRMEFGHSVACDIAWTFCDSPYLRQENYAETLLELIDAFYFFKNTCDGLLSDQELIDAMRAFYDSSCQGSLEMLRDASLSDLCQASGLNLRIYGDRSWNI